MRAKLAICIIAALAVGLGMVDSDQVAVPIEGEGEGTPAGSGSTIRVTARDEAVATVDSNAIHGPLSPNAIAKH